MKTLLKWSQMDGLLLIAIIGLIGLIIIEYNEAQVYAQIQGQSHEKGYRTEVWDAGLTLKHDVWENIVTKREEAIAEALRIEAEKQEAERLIAEANARVWTAITNYTSYETTQNYIWYAWECFSWYGWSAYDLECLITLWHRESRWSPSAHNSSSGAHGIPQSLPASKMASHGADYWDNGYTQIRWGLDYIAGRYGNPANALSHSYAKGWY